MAYESNSSSSILSSEQNNLSHSVLKQMFDYAREHAKTSGSVIRANANGQVASRVLDEKNNDITPKNVSLYSSHDMLNYQGKHFIILKPRLYFADQDNEKGASDPRNRGSREVFLLKDETGKIFIAKIITVSEDLKPRVLEASKNEMELAHKFSNSPFSETVIREKRENQTEILLLQNYLGDSLEQELAKETEKQSLSITQKIHIAIELLKATLKLHQEGYLHRDIKPQNVAIKMNDLGLHDVSLIDYGKAVKFNPTSGEEYKSLDPNSKHSVATDMGHCLGCIYELLEEVRFSLSQDIYTTKEGLKGDDFNNIPKVVKELIKKLQEKLEIQLWKDATNDMVNAYKHQISKSKNLYTFLRHGRIGKKRAKRLQEKCELAQSMNEMYTAYAKCFSSTYFSKSRTNKLSLVTQAKKNQVIYNQFKDKISPSVRNNSFWSVFNKSKITESRQNTKDLLAAIKNYAQ